MLSRRMTVLGLALGFILLCGTEAKAEPTDLAAGEALFEQARKLLADGKVAEACPKFAESHRVAPAAGTALNLGVCYEKQNKLASAWGAYKDAAALSKGTGQADRETYARERAGLLEPRLSRLTIKVDNVVPGLEVRRDGIVVTQAQYNSAIPVDTGAHLIEATATDKEPFRKTVEVKGESSSTTFALPSLNDAAKQVVEQPAPVGSEDKGGALRVIGIGMGVIGLGLLGTGTYFALSSSSTSDDLEAHARNNGTWGPEQSTQFDDGQSAATLANIMFVTGAVVLVAGGVLTVLGYSGKKSSSSNEARAGGTRTRLVAPNGMKWAF